MKFRTPHSIRRHPIHWFCVIVFCALFLCSLQATAKKPRKQASPTPLPAAEFPGSEEVKWQVGPSVGDLGDTAQVRLPEGYVFAGAKDTRLLMEAMHNPETGQELGFVAPPSKEWFVVFEYDDVGYVNDDEKSSLDADAVLKSIREGNEHGNQERARRGWPAFNVVGWEQPPRYNDQTHNLEWAIRGESAGSPVVNYETRLLGRGGVMKATLVVDPAVLSTVMPDFKNVIAAFDFKDGKKYAQFTKGDKVAAYGLSALIVGGAAAVAVKTGAFKWLWKLIVVGVIGLSGFIKKLFSRRKTA